MALKVYNTLTRKLETFEPVKKGHVGMYACGPTVYDFAHIGNFRAYTCADIIRRYLDYKGYKVKQVMNITDVEDKIIRNAGNKGVTIQEYTEPFTKAFFEDLKTLNIKPADVYPQATEYIKEMVDIIKKLKAKGYTYEKDDSTYYRISKFKGYGKLSKINIEESKEGVRIDADEYDKESAHDFVLWKARKGNEPFWETELGNGRPGWHIECSAMSMKNLGETFDIHTGGIDLIFPHHENEIAQSEGATGKPFVKYWLHNEYLFVEGKKMSKSLGNFYTLRDLFAKGYSPRSIRYLLLSAHYRTPLNFTEEGLKAADSSLQRLLEFLSKLKSLKTKAEYNSKLADSTKKLEENFEKAMDEDFNISGALAAIFEFVKEANKAFADSKVSDDNAKEITALFNKFDSVLGVLEQKEQQIPEEIQELAEKREEARKKKDFKTADQMRDKLKEKGYVLEDTPQGPRLKKV